MEKVEIDIKKFSVGVVGIGLMGSSICTCLLVAGHKVVGMEPVAVDLEEVRDRITKELENAFDQGLVQESAIICLERLELTRDYKDLAECGLVIECTMEDLTIKSEVFEKIETVITDTALLTSNTSSIPISVLQQSVKVPVDFLDFIGRFLLRLPDSWKSYVATKVMQSKESSYASSHTTGAKNPYSCAKILEGSWLTG